MVGNEWFEFDKRERRMLMDALRTLKLLKGEDVDPIISKILDGGKHLDITVGVYGGQVQWVLGNPFPVRICDYDGDQADLLDRDARGQECRMWFEPIDGATV
jgi:hypothetical protein